jgi:hypothetical protein
MTATEKIDEEIARLEKIISDLSKISDEENENMSTEQIDIKKVIYFYYSPLMH